MARDKAGTPPLAPGNRLPSLKGVVMIDTFRGAPRVRKWPAKRGPPKTEQHRRQVEMFTWAQAMAKGQPGRTHAAAIDLTKRTGFYPRDVMTAALYGTAWRIALSNGTVYTSMANALTVSENLDLISHVPGSVLVRGTDRWQGVPSPALQATWFPMHENAIITAPIPGGNFATKGTIYTVYNPTMLTRAAIFTGGVANATYRICIARLSAPANAITAIAFGPHVTVPDATARFIDGTALMTVGAGDRVFIGLSRTDLLDTTPMPNTTTSFPNPNMFSIVGAGVLAKRVPAVGDILTLGGAATTLTGLFAASLI